jgi:hypothetical protein
MVFNVKKLLNNGVDLTPWLRDKKKWCQRNQGRSREFRLLIATFCPQMCQHLHLPRAFETACVPLSPEEASWWKIQLSEDLGLAHTAKTFQQFLEEFWNSGGLASIFARLVHAGLLDLACSAGKSPGDTALQSHCPASVYHCGMGVAIEAKYICRSCCSFCCCLGTALAKNGADIESMGC